MRAEGSKSGSYQSSGLSPDRLQALKIGSAVGDAVGLPYEGMSAKAAAKRLRYGLRPRFFFRRLKISDDTEMAYGALLAWQASQGDPSEFRRQQARELRRWMATLPAGIGRATIRAGFRLFLVRNGRTGVHSAGNGPLPRALWLGAVGADDELVRSATEITHTHPSAQEASLIIAAAARTTYPPTQEWLQEQAARITDSEMRQRFLRAVELGQARSPASELMGGKATTGYVGYTLPLTVLLWIRHGGSYAEAIEEAIRLGGDTDSLAFLVGGLCAAAGGADSVPEAWRSQLRDEPITLKGISQDPLPRINRIFYLWRTPMFWLTIWAHVIKRLLGG